MKNQKNDNIDVLLSINDIRDITNDYIANEKQQGRTLAIGGICLTALIGLLTALLNIGTENAEQGFLHALAEHFATFPSLSTVLILVTALAFAITMVLFIQDIRKLWKNLGKCLEDEFCSKIIAKSMGSEKNQAIFLIAHRDKKYGLKFLVYNNKGWKCMFFPHCSFDNHKGDEEQYDSFKNNLNAQVVGTQTPGHYFLREDVKIEYLGRMESRAKIDSGGGKNKLSLFRYRFFLVTLSGFNAYHEVSQYPGFGQSKKTTNADGAEFYWKNISELRGDLATFEKNSDVIDIVEDIERNNDLFKNEQLSSLKFFNEYKRSELTSTDLHENKKIKIIWNITGACQFNCSCCATDSYTCINQGDNKCIDDQRELSIKQKHVALRNIVISEGIVDEIDFAGGDPLMIPEVCGLIKVADEFLGKNRIAVSSTGSSIRQLIDANDPLNFFGTFDFTLDFPKQFDVRSLSSNLRESNYFSDNIDLAVELSQERKIKTNAQIPIFVENNQTAIINKLITHIKTIRPDSVTLLRLMPVGRVRYNEYPPGGYNPEGFIENFVEEFDKNIRKKNIRTRLRLHCSLRCFYSDVKTGKEFKYPHEREEKYCNMLEDKIGIDRNGNVYACPWAANIPVEDPSTNPFFIGNITKNSLDQILCSDEARRMRERLEEEKKRGNNKFCRIFSYYEHIESPDAIYLPSFPRQSPPNVQLTSSSQHNSVKSVHRQNIKVQSPATPENKTIRKKTARKKAIRPRTNSDKNKGHE